MPSLAVSARHMPARHMTIEPIFAGTSHHVSGAKLILGGSFNTLSGLVNCGDIEQWCQVLLRAFKLSPDEAFVAFDAIRYTVRDALNRRYPDAYTFFLISAAEECGIPEADFAMWAWLHLEYPLRCLIPRPKKGVTILGFTRVLYQVINREYWEKTSDPPAQPSQRIQPMQPAMSAVISQTPFRPASPADTSSNTLSEGTVM